jgi:hypothetical protein
LLNYYKDLQINLNGINKTSPEVSDIRNESKLVSMAPVIWGGLKTKLGDSKNRKSQAMDGINLEFLKYESNTMEIDF